MNKLSLSFLALSFFTNINILHAEVCLLVDQISEKCLWVFETDKEPQENTKIGSFNTAKEILEEQVYNWRKLQRETIYCWCSYSERKYIDDTTCSFENNWKYDNRKNRVEWEHIVPKSNYPENHDATSDIYNLYPAIWSINAQRSNFIFWEIPWEEREFWKCNIEIAWDVAEPRPEIMWDIARIHEYMQWTYRDYQVITPINRETLKLWDTIDPVSEEECERYRIIEKIQQNINFVLEERCEWMFKKM